MENFFHHPLEILLQVNITVFMTQDFNYVFLRKPWGYAVAQLVKATELQAERSRVRFPMVSLEFFIDIIPPAALWPWGQLSL